MKVYVVYINYINFEDYSNNFIEILGLFDTKRQAIKRIREQDAIERETDMIKSNVKAVEKLIADKGQVVYNQRQGRGKSILVLEEHDLQRIGVS